MSSVSFKTFIVIKFRPLIIVTIFMCVQLMHRQKIDLSNDVSFMKIVHVVCDSRPERQYIVFTPRIMFRDKNQLMDNKVYGESYHSDEEGVYMCYNMFEKGRKVSLRTENTCMPYAKHCSKVYFELN